MSASGDLDGEPGSDRGGRQDGQDGQDGMVGVVLAAGTGRRLRPYSDNLPKALVPLPTGDADDRAADHPGPLTPLDVILGNFARSGVTDVAIVVGYAAEAVRERAPLLEKRYGVALELVPNERALTWNNCYSLWCARELFSRDVLLSNGDTVHPIAVEHALLQGPLSPSIVLATDTVKHLGDEEMKVTWSQERGVEEITKLMDPAKAYGEYIGVATIHHAVADALTAALEATWSRNPDLYYEDGFQELIDRGGEGSRVDARPIGEQSWVEIDDHADLERAGEVLRKMELREQAERSAEPRDEASAARGARDEPEATKGMEL